MRTDAGVSKRIDVTSPMSKRRLSKVILNHAFRMLIVLYSNLLYTTLLYSTRLDSTRLDSTLLCSALLYSTLLYSTLLSSPLLYSTLLYTTPHHTTTHHAMRCYAMLCPAPRCPLNHPIPNPTPSPSTQNPMRIIYNSRKNQVYNTSQQKPRMLSKCIPKCLKITHQSSKNAPQASTGTLPGTTPEKNSRITLWRMPQGSPSWTTKITQRSA